MKPSPDFGFHKYPVLIPTLFGPGFITTHALLSLPLKACPHVYDANFLPGQLALCGRDVMTQKG